MPPSPAPGAHACTSAGRGGPAGQEAAQRPARCPTRLMRQGPVQARPLWICWSLELELAQKEQLPPLKSEARRLRPLRPWAADDDYHKHSSAPLAFCSIVLASTSPARDSKRPVACCTGPTGPISALLLRPAAFRHAPARPGPRQPAQCHARCPARDHAAGAPETLYIMLQCDQGRPGGERRALPFGRCPIEEQQPAGRLRTSGGRGRKRRSEQAGGGAGWVRP